jgi:hypothetical protein
VGNQANHLEVRAMRTSWMLTVACTISGLGGCASSFDAIPMGEWVGQGTYTRQVFDQKTPPQVESGQYETRLLVEKRHLHGRDVLLFEILSKHGKDSFSKDVRISMGLLKQKTMLTGATACAIVGYGVQITEGASIDPSLWKEPTEDELQKALNEASPCPASCDRFLGAVVLRIDYDRISPSGTSADRFEDTFTFIADRLSKKGQFRSTEKNGDITTPVIINWTEELRKVR